eukprot:gene6430-8535_t
MVFDAFISDCAARSVKSDAIGTGSNIVIMSMIILEESPKRLHDRGLPMTMGKRSFFAACAILALGSASQAQNRLPTLEVVKQRGVVVCGSNTGLPGFSVPDKEGNWSGFDVDFCRAI